MKFYGWKSFNEMLVSIAPSLKYKFTFNILSISGGVAFFESLFGFKTATLIALMVLMITELVSGIYCSLKIRKEPFESSKMWRFFFKAGMFFVINYCLFQFLKEFKGKNLLEELFEWLYNGLLTYAILEIIISVLENYAEIQGKKKDFYTSYIKEKIKSIIKTDGQNY